MIRNALLLAILCALQCNLSVAEDALRVFIRSGPKTHGPGAHDHPSFLKDWTALLNERGAQATGGDRFPPADQLAETDVLILHAEEAGNIEGVERRNLETFLNRGGGVVALHGGTVSRDPDWYKSVIGGSWRFGQTKWLEGPMSLYFTDRENPVTRGVSNFDLDDEIYYDMDLLPEIQVLAAAYTPKPKEGPAGEGQAVNIYDIQPQIWTYETGNRRAFACIPGHLYKNFSHTSLQTLLLRGIAWAGKMEDPDALLSNEETLDDALRYPVGGPTRPEEAADKIELHPEFDLSLVAAEPLVNKAMNLDWDAQGRMWVVESPEYPNGLRKANTEIWKESGSVDPGEYDRDPLDRISILTDTDGDGRMDRKHVFADKLELATGFVFHNNGVIVSAAPDIWFLEDTDGDEVADKRTKLYTGLGTRDTHAVINNLRWGLDGWIYATHGYSAGKVKSLGAPDLPEVGIGSGVLRFKPDGTRIEMYSSKGGNTWGLDMTADGRCFWTQPTSGTVLFHTVLPEYVLEQGKIPGTNSFHGMIVRQPTFPLLTWEQAAYRQIDLVGSYTAAAGCAIYQGGAWPEKWNDSYFTGEPTINLVSQYFLRPNGVTYTAEKEQGREKTEFIRSSDLWFRPIETRVGPDGALYLIDFYNQAVIHNDTRGPRHGPANAAVRPDRDHYFGRIWRVQHKQAETVTVPALDKDDTEGLTKALDHPNAHTRMTAHRLLREAGKPVAAAAGSAPLEAYRKFSDPTDAAARDALLNAFAGAEDDWTRSALIAAASSAPTELILATLNSPSPDPLAPLVANLLPAALSSDPSSTATTLVVASASAPQASSALKITILQALSANKKVQPALTKPLTDSLGALLGDAQTASTALPLIARWDRNGRMKETVAGQVDKLAEKLANPTTAAKQRLDAARALIAVGEERAIAATVATLQDPDSPETIRLGILSKLGESAHAARLAPIFSQLDPSLRNAAFDAIVAHPAAALALLKAVEGGKVEPDDIGPGNVARLRNHPDRKVAEQAESMVDQLVPGMKKTRELIAQFLPEVRKPGDAANGKLMFAAACAICHKYDDLGTSDVGPTLNGMGSHGPEELLTHIIDPNREVDPSYWQWNITTKDGRSLAGVITSENATSLTLRSQAGDTELKKEDIARRENTRRSLMPEGLGGLGPDVLRNILAYMTNTDAGRYRVIDLREAYTADARRGLFADVKATRDSVFFRKFGHLDHKGVPFFLMDPAKSPNGRSLVVLKGGQSGNAARTYPQKVEIPTDIEASRLYLVSGVAGWGFPAIGDERVALKVTLTHEDGTTESKEFLNKVHFGDYNRVVNVPGSKLLKGWVKAGQIRMLTVDIKKPGSVRKITLESADNRISPVVAAITADLSNEPAEFSTTASAHNTTRPDLANLPPNSTAATGQKFAEPRKPDSLRVLLVGAGQAHHFPRDFIATDRETLSRIKHADVIGTMNLDEALAAIQLADVLVFSGNHDQWGSERFQRALHEFADSGKGMVMLHAATWSHPWEGYNERFVSGRTTGHGKGEFEVTIKKPGHPIASKVKPKFTIWDENYRFRFEGASKHQLLAVNEPDKTDGPIPSVWIVKDPKARIVCITLGHDQRAHSHQDFQRLLINSVNWAGGS